MTSLRYYAKNEFQMKTILSINSFQNLTFRSIIRYELFSKDFHHLYITKYNKDLQDLCTSKHAFTTFPFMLCSVSISLCSTPPPAMTRSISGAFVVPNAFILKRKTAFITIFFVISRTLKQNCLKKIKPNFVN